MSGPSELLAQRYGADRPRRRAVIVVLVAILAAVFVGWVLWAAWQHSNPAIDADVSAYRIVDEHRAEAKVVARYRDADTDGTCLLRATAEDHTIVGELNITADELRAAKGTWIPLRTEREATTVTLVRCSGAG